MESESGIEGGGCKTEKTVLMNTEGLHSTAKISTLVQVAPLGGRVVYKWDSPLIVWVAIDSSAPGVLLRGSRRA